MTAAVPDGLLPFSPVGVNRLEAHHHPESKEAQALLLGDGNQGARFVHEAQISVKAEVLPEARVTALGVLHPGKCAGVSHQEA